MEKRYYTPTIEEFRVGFEYEVFEKGKSLPESFTFMPIETEDKWYRFKYPDPFYGYQLDKIFKRDIRVKYLDAEDIESLGFKKEDGESYYAFKGRKYGANTIILQPFDKYIKIIYNVYMRLPKTLFQGAIKNKSELIVLLKQLGIQ